METADHQPSSRGRRTSLYDIFSSKEHRTSVPSDPGVEKLKRSNSVTTSNIFGHKGMVKSLHVTVAGAKGVGKSSILQQLAFCKNITSEPYCPTIDDTFQVQMDPGDRAKEILVFHDTAGIPAEGPAQLRRPYIQVADAFILVYSIDNIESFNQVDFLKKFLDKQQQANKDRREIPIVVLGNKTDLSDRKVEVEFAVNWSQREKVKLYEVTATSRKTLLEPIVYLGARLFHPPKESMKFLSRKLKPEKSGAAILMDI